MNSKVDQLLAGLKERGYTDIRDVSTYNGTIRGELWTEDDKVLYFSFKPTALISIEACIELILSKVNNKWIM